MYQPAGFSSNIQMRLIRLKYILPFFLISLFIGCKKEPDNIPPEDHIDTAFVDKDLKQNYLFNPGSKWIYKSEKSEFDTVKLISQQRLFVGPIWVHGVQATNCAEFYTSYYKSNTKDSFIDVYNLNYIMRNPTGDYWFSFNSNGIIYIPFHITGDSTREIKLLEIIDSLTLFGKTYLNVAKIQKLKDENENYHDTYYYFAKHFGIIRKEIKDSITWDLYESDIK